MDKSARQALHFCKQMSWVLKPIFTFMNDGGPDTRTAAAAAVASVVVAYRPESASSDPFLELLELFLN